MNIMNRNLENIFHLIKYIKSDFRKYISVKHVELKASRINNSRNIYFATVQRSGSQWVKKIFSDPEIIKFTELVTYPQHDYENWMNIEKFPENTFVPGLYINFNDFKKIKKPKDYKVFYIVRDPRDVVVSWYFSVKTNHSLTSDGIVKFLRNRLNKLSLEEGLIWGIKFHDFYGVFDAQKSWMEAYQDKLDSNLLLIKFEDLINDNYKYIKKLFDHCNVSVPDSIINNIIDKYSFKKLSIEDRGHYRKGKVGNYKEIFTPRVTRVQYKKVTPIKQPTASP